MKKYNFNAGPSKLPKEVMEAVSKACIEFEGSGLSLMEMSHRAKNFQPVLDEAVALFKELLNIPEGYSVLFLGGGASLEFCMIPYNFLEQKAAYINTGVWAKKAMAEAKLFGECVEVASSADFNYTYIPKHYTVPADADYFHITTNNTIYGTEIRRDLDSPVPLIADMSSDIFSRPINVSKYAMIYGGAQKNVGPAGVTFFIVKKDLLGKVSRYIPTMLDLRTHIDGASMFNTPPVFAIYVMNETLKWLKAQGGVEAIYEINKKKAELLKGFLDFVSEKLEGSVKEVRLSANLGSHPVSMVPEGGMSFEMEKYMKRVNPEYAYTVGRVLELNADHPAVQALQNALTTDPIKAKDYAQLLMYQAQLMADLPIDDPVAYTDLVCKLMQ